MAILPSLLIEQVRMAAPFLFEGPQPEGPARRYLRVLRAYDGLELNALEYYELCLCAHWATAGSFVPTDVDNGIRWKHWQDVQPGLVEEQAKLVLESLSWDYAPVTAKITGEGARRLSTHEGTWFSVAVGAYAACLEARPALSTIVLDAMRTEADREDRAYAASGGPLELLKSSALIAHNFGDLDRVADQWELAPGDPLRRALYDAAKPGSPLFGGRLGRAGLLHQKHMGADNHRHYPLRSAKGLRKSADLLLPVGPFFDDWGRRVGRHPALTPEEVAEAVRALTDGWVRMHAPAGYARALSGILEVFPGGRRALGKLLPAKDQRMLESGPLKAAMDIPQERFEAQWANKVAKDRGASALRALMAAGQLFLCGMAWSAPLEDGKAALSSGDLKTAVILFESEAKKGNAEALLELGRCYQTGRGVKKDIGTAIRHFETAAERGNTRAAVYLWGHYREGKAIPRDAPKAMQWLRHAAAHDDTLAQTILGGMHYKGSPEDGVTQDYVKAIGWFRKAAGLGDDEARANLCAAYSDGKGVRKDLIEAYAWCLLANKPGIRFVGDMMSRMERELTAEQIASARLRAGALERKARPPRGL